jgi:hypothetical protein
MVAKATQVIRNTYGDHEVEEFAGISHAGVYEPNNGGYQHYDVAESPERRGTLMRSVPIAFEPLRLVTQRGVAPELA